MVFDFHNNHGGRFILITLVLLVAGCATGLSEREKSRLRLAALDAYGRELSKKQVAMITSYDFQEAEELKTFVESLVERNRKSSEIQVGREENLRYIARSFDKAEEAYDLVKDVVNKYNEVRKKRGNFGKIEKEMPGLINKASDLIEKALKMLDKATALIEKTPLNPEQRQSFRDRHDRHLENVKAHRGLLGDVVEGLSEKK